MNYSQFESTKLLKERIKGFKQICTINKGLRIIGLGSKKISEIEGKIIKLGKDLETLIETPQEFNRLFSARGWISYDSLNVEFMQKVIQTYKHEGIDQSEELLLDHYKPKNLGLEIKKLRWVPSIAERYKFVEYAYIDYEAKRYYSVVLNLLTIIDGTINDVLGVGLHSKDANTDVWESITSIDHGLETIKSIFRKGRKKTRTGQINLPFRNGILHGMDLGYDNYIVAAKCWHFLFIIRDWTLSKKSETSRKAAFEKDKNIPSWSELIRSVKYNAEAKEHLNKWKPRKFTSDYLKEVNEGTIQLNDLPEIVAQGFLKYWIKRNYGKMSDLYWSKGFYNPNKIAKEMRELFDYRLLEEFSIVGIRDEAAAITEIDLNLKINEISCEYAMRMLYESQEGLSSIRNFEKGSWKIIFVREMTNKS